MKFFFAFFNTFSMKMFVCDFLSPIFATSYEQETPLVTAIGLVLTRKRQNNPVFITNLISYQTYEQIRTRKLYRCKGRSEQR